MTNPTMLDADELLHFAIKASRSNENEKAILYLKHALALDPANAKIHYFLGAQHAEIGMYDRAIADMSKAVSIDSSLDTAHFQLGLLYATSGRIAEAASAWKALDKLGEKHALYLFKSGLIHLASDEFAEAQKYLTQGIELNKANPDLNKDMLKILHNVQTAIENATPARTDGGGTKSTGGNNIFLAAYNNEEDEDTNKDKKH